MQWPAARIRLVAPRNAPPRSRSSTDASYPSGWYSSKKPNRPPKIFRASELGLRQNSGENAGARRLAGLHALGQRPVEDALAIASGVAVSDPEGGEHLFRRQTH